MRLMPKIFIVAMFSLIFWGWSPIAHSFAERYYIPLTNGYELWHLSQNAFQILDSEDNREVLFIDPVLDNWILAEYCELPEVILIKVKKIHQHDSKSFKEEVKIFSINNSSGEVSEYPGEMEFRDKSIDISRDTKLIWIVPQNPNPEREQYMRRVLMTMVWIPRIGFIFLVPFLLLLWRYINLKKKFEAEL